MLFRSPLPLNAKLPDKYKPASRRVTAIIVGIPFVLVLGYEVYQRLFEGKVQRKFGAGDEEDKRGFWNLSGR